MKQFDENDLIAYHLQELPPRKRKALEHALERDAELAAESASIAETLRGFKGHSPFQLDPRLYEGLVQWNWQVLSAALPRYSVTKPPTFVRRHLPVLAGAGLAFAAVTVTLVTRHRGSFVPQHATLRPALKAPTVSMSRQDAATGSRSSAVSGAGEERTVRKPSAAWPRRALATPAGMPEGSLFAAENRLASPRPIQALPAPKTVPDAVIAPALAAPPASGFSSSLNAEPESGVAAQSSATVPARANRQRTTVHHHHTTELTLAMGGTLIGSSGAVTNSVNRTRGATHAVIAMALFHQQFRPAAGYQLAFSYTRPEFSYSYGSPGYINGRVYEAAATYVVQGPGRGRLSTSAEAGAGVMRFTPTIKEATTGDNTRVAGIFGVAANLMLSKHIGLRAAYRGQVFKGPDFQYSGISAPITTSTLLSNEPSLGITYRFSHR